MYKFSVFQDNLSGSGAVPALVNLLESEVEDVLVNAVNAIRVMCINNSANQSAIADNDGIEPLVEFLSVSQLFDFWVSINKRSKI